MANVRIAMAGIWIVVVVQMMMLSSASHAQSSAPPTESPKQLLMRFYEMDTNGKQLTQAGWSEMGQFFVRPGDQIPDKITVIRGYVIGDPFIRGNVAQIYSEFTEVERLDSKLNFSDEFGFKWPGTHPMKVRVLNKIVRSDPGATWKIDGTRLEPHVTIETAIRYVTERRDHAKTRSERENAKRALAALTKQLE